jgi:hypothetical protein
VSEVELRLYCYRRCVIFLSPLFSESGVAQPRRGAVPTVQHSAVIQLWGVPFLPGVMGTVPSMTFFIIVVVNLLNGLVVKLTFFCKDETHGVKEFWECVNLDRKVTKERVCFIVFNYTFTFDCTLLTCYLPRSLLRRKQN